MNAEDCGPFDDLLVSTSVLPSDVEEFAEVANGLAGVEERVQYHYTVDSSA